MLIIGTIIVGLLSFIAGFFWARLKQAWLAFALACMFPVCVSWPVYWLPLLNVRDTSEYSTWYGVFAIFWLMFALPISVATTLLVRRALRKKRTNAG
jgi:Na+/proline symporter